MRVISLNNRKLTYLDLPNEVDGSFWIDNPLDKKNHLINIESQNKQWLLKSNADYQVIDNDHFIDEKVLSPNELYSYGNQTECRYIYAMNNYDPTMKIYQVNDGSMVTIGSDKNSILFYTQKNILPLHLSLGFKNDIWEMTINEKAIIYVNDNCVRTIKTTLKNGDTLFIMGLVITVIKNMIILNNPNNLVSIQSNILSPLVINPETSTYEDVKEIDYYRPEDYFFKTPRLRRFINTYELKIASPPSPNKEEKMPWILLLGPMLTMGITSVVTLANSIMRLTSGEDTIAKSWPTLVTSFAMLIATFLWPNLTRKYQDKIAKVHEKKRVNEYREYLAKKRKLLEIEAVTQRDILTDNLLDSLTCYNIIKTKQRVLWERKISQKDFLTVRVGVGDVKLDANIEFDEDEFVLDEDDLKSEAERLIKNYKMLHSAPVGYSFYNKKATAIMGIENAVLPFIDNVILQLITFHSYDDLKIVVFTDSNSDCDWNYLLKLPHCFSNERDIRFFSTNEDDAKKISSYLEQEFLKRQQMHENEEGKVKNENEEVKDQEDEKEKKQKIDSGPTYLPYYLIITDNYLSIRKLGITQLIMKSEENMGFSFFIKENRLGRLPSECETFINIGTSYSGILCTSIDNSFSQDFTNQIVNNIDMNECAKILSNIPIEFNSDFHNLPMSLSFLEMYGVGKIEQLNILNRWRLNDSTKTLRAPVGINDTKTIIYLDLHEKYHGPHGLIAGTTGSGKSEFIITYILSMAINYSPNDVAFILIDYKGGGLAGAFENDTNHIKLPHLAGIITNLDKSELNRTFVSIQSEMQRRQKKFNEARDILGESTMDIYKYQRFFKEKKLTEPIPHLFIICDEFAELKAQQPEFMDNLISAARIGRSLGVHLILATQKPNGVVNDQIWSNSKFRVCLKVQDQADSNEMLKCPDAAAITNAGRFYLQVGYNEIFVLGQSGWCGAPYIPKDIVNEQIDHSLDFIDDTANVIKSVGDNSAANQALSQGEQLLNILKAIIDYATKENIYAKQLWLENIPKDIYVDNLVQKYKYTVTNDKVSAIIGEYDNPYEQTQSILSLDLDANGNTLVFGLSGIGREMFVKSLIYSCSILYSSQDINFYIFDFGSESLRILSKLPHVGDIAFAAEPEKITKMLAMMNNEIEYRKKLFADYNGDYFNYIKTSGKKLPIYEIIFNSYDSFIESYDSYADLIMKLARDGQRYGVLMLLTATSQSGMFGRLTKNFSHTFVMNMNDKNDYMDILGKIGDTYPKDYDGRGLFKINQTYEFQVSQVCEDNKFVEFIKEKANELQKINLYPVAKVPVLPERVTYDLIMNPNMRLDAIPIGIIRDNLKVCLYNFTDDKATLVVSNDINDCALEIKSIIHCLSKVKNIIPIVLDAEKVLTSIQGICPNCYSNHFDEVITKLNTFVDEKLKGTPYKMLVIIIGLDKLVSTMKKSDFESFIEKTKTMDNVNFIYSESSYKLKRYAFDSWYSGSVINANGIWVGPGIMEQAIIKIDEMDRKYREKVTNEYAWVVKNSMGSIVKLVNEERDDHHEK